jgi:hypothetical protein
METAKEEVRRILDSLPDDATLEDIQHRIYVRQAIAAELRNTAEKRLSGGCGDGRRSSLVPFGYGRPRIDCRADLP